MISSTTLRQQMASASLSQSSQACMAVVSALQNFPRKGDMLSGLTSCFVLVSELTGISIPDLITYAKNAMTDGNDRYPQYRAAKDFIEKEILS
jgi:hypothetical protein